MSDRQFYNRQFSSGLAIVAFVIIGGLVIGVAALALGQFFKGSDVIKVPGDYSTIQAAINAADPGEVIQVRAGTYNENILLDKAVSLIAESFDQINPVNNHTIIDGMGGGATILIPAGLTQMPTIRGFVIQNSSNAIQASSEFIAEFNYFHSSTMLVNYQGGGGGINRNNVYFSSADDAIHLDSPIRPLLIENNRIMYAGDDGIEVNLQNNPVPASVIEIDIWNNMIIGSREDGIQFVDFPGDPQDTNRRFVIVSSLIAANAKAGIGLMPNGNTIEDFSGADTAEAIRVYNNTFYGNNYGISGGDNLVAFNNIIVNSVTRGVWRVQGAPGADSVIAFTLFNGNKMDAEESTLVTGILVGLDPLFQAAPNPGPDGTWQTVDDDFSGLVLQSGSPAIDKGIAQLVAANGEKVPPIPITGFVGPAPDLGWREFGSPAFITATPSPIPPPTLLATITVQPLPTLPTLSTQTAIVVTATPGPATATPVSPSPPATSTTAPSATPITPSLTPTLGITASPTPQLAIQSINPIGAQANTTINLTITGSGFQNGAVVAFEGGVGTPPEIVTVQVMNPTTIIAMINVKGTPQIWDVRVTNQDNSTAVLLDAFTVNP